MYFEAHSERKMASIFKNHTHPKRPPENTTATCLMWKSTACIKRLCISKINLRNARKTKSMTKSNDANIILFLIKSCRP